jgi:hypothetical protein
LYICVLIPRHLHKQTNIVYFFFFAEQHCSAKFNTEIREIRVKEGLKAKFEATFAGNPAPVVTWEFDGKAIENSKNIQIKVKEGRTTLTIFEATMENNGFYTCRVKNSLAADKTRASLTVSSKYPF